MLPGALGPPGVPAAVPPPRMLGPSSGPGDPIGDAPPGEPEPAGDQLPAGPLGALSGGTAGPGAVGAAPGTAWPPPKPGFCSGPDGVPGAGFSSAAPVRPGSPDSPGRGLCCPPGHCDPGSGRGWLGLLTRPHQQGDNDCCHRAGGDPTAMVRLVRRPRVLRGLVSGGSVCTARLRPGWSAPCRGGSGRLFLLRFHHRSGLRPAAAAGGGTRVPRATLTHFRHIHPEFAGFALRPAVRRRPRTPP